MTTTEKNNILYRHLLYFTNRDGFIARQCKAVADIVKPYTALAGPHIVPPLDTSTEKLVERLAGFLKRESNLKPSKIVAIEHLVKDLQSLQTKPDHAEVSVGALMKDLEMIKQRLQSVSPSEHVEMSDRTKKGLRELLASLKLVLISPGIESVISPNRMRILREDLTYIQKREHLFIADKTT